VNQSQPIPGPSPKDDRARPLSLRAIAAGLSLAAALPALAGCNPTVDRVSADQRWARAELLATYTPLPAATATLTPFPSSTPTAPYQTPTPDVYQAAGLPVRLEIPAIGVDAVIEKVGRDATGAVDVPKISANVAWFTESALPGQGDKASVIVGHLDDPYGPAVFYHLRRLRPGDEMAVTYENGDRHIFVVESKERYTHNVVPAQRLYGATSHEMLNLMTCDGAWDAGHANYEQRLVVYSHLKRAEPASAPTPPSSG